MQPHTWSLKAKIFLILLAIVLAYALADYGIQRLVILPSFLSLERSEARQDAERAVEAITREIHHLDGLAFDWAAWDDTYAFIQDRNPDYVESNLVLSSFVGNDLNVIYLVNLEGEVVWGEVRDLDSEETIDVGEFPKDSMPSTHLLLAHTNADAYEDSLADLSLKGVFMTDRGPMLVAARPIITSDEEGPVRGTLIMGRFFNRALIETLVEQTRVTFDTWAIPGDSMPAEERSVAARITPGDPFSIIESAEGPLRVYTTMADVAGAPTLLIRADVPRDISARGATAVVFALMSIVAAGLLLLGVLWSTLQRVVVGPISRLTAHAVWIGTSGDLTRRLSMPRRDEIGTLAEGFDRMVSQLAEARKTLAEQSYRSGIAEVASGVLHNVGNALNPVIVELDGVHQELRQTPLDQIDMAEQMLAESNPSDGRREDLTQFLSLAYQSLVPVVRRASAGLADVVRRVGQVEQILADHRHLGDTERPIEVVDFDDVLQDALRLIPAELEKTITIETEPAVAASGKGRAHRIVLVQVCANLLANAAEAIQRAGATRGVVHVSTKVDEVDGSDMLHVTLRDTGVGIAPDILERIFERGFTTKASGASGLGLHWNATVLATMGGRIFAESDGVGRGACLHVLIPKSP